MRRTQCVLLIHNSREDATQLLVENTRAALRDACLDYEMADFSDALHLPALRAFDSVLLCAEQLDELGTQGIVDIADYVTDGGGLVLLRRAWHPELAPVAGIKRVKVAPEILTLPTSDEGLCFITDTLPGFAATEVSSEELAGHCPYDVRPRESARVFATSEQGFPIAWLARHGAGRTICWNSALMHSKRMRGLIIQSIMAVQQVGILPIANVAVIQIDDFPAPLQHDDRSPVSEEFPGLNSSDFYGLVWHPDMLALAERQGLVYTYFPIFNYNDKVAPPFPFDEWDHQKITVEGTQRIACIHAARIAGQTGELGLHGYNHMSLLTDVWSSQEAMRTALRDVASKWKNDRLAELPISYVPPNNEYDEQGLAALCSALSTLQVICGSFLHHDPDKGGQREFGCEPWNSKLFCIPRATSGYEYSGEMKFDALSQMGTSGIWTHFIHADDVFDVPRGSELDPYCRNPRNRGWRVSSGKVPKERGLLHEFEAWLIDFRRRFPWLRFVSTKEAYALIKDHLQQKWVISADQSHATIRTERGRYFQIRLNDGREIAGNSISGAELLGTERIDKGVVYTLLATAATVIVPFRRESWIARILAPFRSDHPTRD